MTISLSATITRSKRIAARMFEAKMLVVTVDDSKLHRMDDVGTFIWEQLDSPLTVKQILKRVTDHFDEFSEEKQKEEIFGFLEKLEKKRLITVAN